MDKDLNRYRHHLLMFWGKEPVDRGQLLYEFLPGYYGFFKMMNKAMPVTIGALVVLFFMVFRYWPEYTFFYGVAFMAMLVIFLLPALVGWDLYRLRIYSNGIETNFSQWPKLYKEKGQELPADPFTIWFPGRAQPLGPKFMGRERILGVRLVKFAWLKGYEILVRFIAQDKKGLFLVADTNIKMDTKKVLVALERMYGTRWKDIYDDEPRIEFKWGNP